MNIRLTDFYSIDFLCDAYQNGPRLAYFKTKKSGENGNFDASKNTPVPTLQNGVEYMLTTGGEVTLTVNGEVQTLRRGDFIFLRSGQAEFCDFSDDFSFLSLGVLSMDFSFENTPAFACGDRFPEFLFYFEAVERELKTEKGGRKKMLRGLFSCLHILLKRRAADTERKLPEKKPVKALLNVSLPAKKFIDAHYAQELDLKFLSGICGVTQQHLIKQFKALTGLSPHQYLNRVRILAAANLLLSKNESVKDISEKVGFQESHSFLYTFKKFLGATPVDFRKKYENDPAVGLAYAKFATAKKEADEKTDEENETANL